MAELRHAAVRLGLLSGWEGEIRERPQQPPAAGSAAGAGVADAADAAAAITPVAGRSFALAGETDAPPAPPAPSAPSAPSAPPPPLATVHAANFPLPPARGDYGSGAVEQMPPDGVFVSLLEFATDSANTALFAQEGLPLPLDPAAFSPRQLQRPQRAQAGLQTFFTIGGRPFCLYVVIGSLARRDALVAEANRLLGELRFL